MQVLKRSGIDLIPCGIPARLVDMDTVGKVVSAEVVAYRWQVCDQRDVGSADRKKQAIAVRVFIDIASKALRRHHERVVGMTCEVGNPLKIEADADEDDSQRAQSHPAAVLHEGRRSDAYNEDKRESDDLVIARLHVVVPASEEDVSASGQQRGYKERIRP